MIGRRTGWVLAATLAALACHTRARLSFESPRFDPEDETGYFRAESAFQYRYARLVASGAGIPELDVDAQYPEGVRTRRELTSVMERLTGWSYRALPAGARPEFRRFVLLWVAAVSSLSLLAFYALALRLGRSPPLALAGTAAYGLSWAAAANVIGAYRIETLALPLLHAAIAALAGLLDESEKRRALHGALYALCLAAALVSWHFARFLVVALAAAGLWAAWRCRSERKALLRLRAAAAWSGVALAAAALASSSLRESLLVASSASYGHVYGLFWAKLRHGLSKPLDPSALPLETRLEWTGPSNAPEAGFLVFSLFPLLFVLAPRLLALSRREAAAGPRPAAPLVDALAWLLVLGAALVSRLVPVAAFFVLAAALLVPERRRAGAALLIALLAGVEFLKAGAPASPANPLLALSARFAAPDLKPSVSLHDERELLSWLRAKAPGLPVAANMGLSATVLAYAGNPVVLQPKFEARVTRTKAGEFATALFGPEEELAEFCRRYGARLLVYAVDFALDQTPDGALYAAGRRALPADSAAALMHFEPGRLKRFELVFENEGYRVFALRPASLPAWRRPPAPIYDPRVVGVRPAPDGALSVDIRELLRRQEEARVRLFVARLLAQSGRRGEALRLYDDAFAAWPPGPALRAERRRVSGF